jgi:hypothetical protein
LEFCYNSDRNYVSNPVPDESVLQAWMISIARNMSDVIEELLEGVSVVLHGALGFQ